MRPLALGTLLALVMLSGCGSGGGSEAEGQLAGPNFCEAMELQRRALGGFRTAIEGGRIPDADDRQQIVDAADTLENSAPEEVSAEVATYADGLRAVADEDDAAEPPKDFDLAGIRLQAYHDEHC